MSPAPLPPHERAWRHPSELVVAEHEPTTPGGRILIVTTATFSLILVGLLAISMTPERTAAPDATSATITLPPPRTRDGSTAGQAPDAAGRVTETDASDPGTTPAVTPARPAATLALSTTSSVTMTPASYPMLTPVGDEGFAVTSARAAGDEPSLEAQLPSGQLVEVEVVSVADGVVVVVLPTAARSPGFSLSVTKRVGPTDTVAVRAFGEVEPMIVTLLELAELDIADGTPVTDADGNLIGICTRDHDAGTASTSLTPVATMPSTPPTSTPTTSAPATSPTTTLAPTTTSSTVAVTTTVVTVSGTDAASDGSG